MDQISTMAQDTTGRVPRGVRDKGDGFHNYWDSFPVSQTRERSDVGSYNNPLNRHGIVQPQSTDR